jgi:hypothetical protein
MKKREVNVFCILLPIVCFSLINLLYCLFILSNLPNHSPYVLVSYVRFNASLSSCFCNKLSYNSHCFSFWVSCCVMYVVHILHYSATVRSLAIANGFVWALMSLIGRSFHRKTSDRIRISDFKSAGHSAFHVFLIEKRYTSAQQLEKTHSLFLLFLYYSYQIHFLFFFFYMYIIYIMIIDLILRWSLKIRLDSI